MDGAGPTGFSERLVGEGRSGATAGLYAWQPRASAGRPRDGKFATARRVDARKRGGSWVSRGGGPRHEKTNRMRVMTGELAGVGYGYGFRDGLGFWV